ncbi:MAG TPA: L-aspartate oxidase [Vicinamibacterales bacterium]|nr:L-aspartate oxidase [Vicinamibacterales bacterium]
MRSSRSVDAFTSPDVVDFLIVGGGIAGLRAAIALAPSGRVLVLTKAEPTDSNTGVAQGGIAAAVGDDDSPTLHAEDTIRAGDGLCDADAVRVLVENGPAGVGDLIAWGARFERDADGRLVLGREAAHSVRRVLHAGDATGREIGRVLWEKVRTLASVTTIEHALVTELAVERFAREGDGGCVRGAVYCDVDGRRQKVRAEATLLATGGAGQVFRETTNPAVATGDGVALAYQAGARVADLEFVQFHPTALNLSGAPRFLMSEALRGEGARLVNVHGQPFMRDVHPDGDLAPRDVVARGIARESERTGGPVFLTLAHLDPAFVRRRFPTIAEMCRQVGLDLASDPVPVGPAAHYIMGGVDTDEWGRTSLLGLYAAGEVACTGVHGANRLASNSLLEGLVFGARAARAMTEPPRAAPLKKDRVMADSAWLVAHRQPPAISHLPSALTSNEVRDLMWRSVGLFRIRADLEQAVARLDVAAAAAAAAPPADGWRHRNLVTVARLIARSALRREESRGGHCRADFPERDDIHWRVHVVDQATWEHTHKHGATRQIL